MSVLSDGSNNGKTVVLSPTYRRTVAIFQHLSRRPAGSPAAKRSGRRRALRAKNYLNSNSKMKKEKMGYRFSVEKFSELTYAHRRDPPPGGGAPLPRSLRSSQKIVIAFTLLLPHFLFDQIIVIGL